jgi:hypothetical protein
MGIIETLLVAFCNDGAISVKEFKASTSIVVVVVAYQDGFYFFVLGYVFPEFSSAVEFVVCLLAIFEEEVHFDILRFHVESDKLVGVTLLLRQRNGGCLWLCQRCIKRSLSGNELFGSDRLVLLGRLSGTCTSERHVRLGLLSGTCRSDRHVRLGLMVGTYQYVTYFFLCLAHQVVERV